MEMFGASPSSHEMSVVKLRDSAFKIKLLSKEYQHTCKSTGLMLWESARLMASVLDRNPNIVSGKRVLELGCGCTGICSMVAARSASLVVATDADTKALKTGVLEWGNKEHIESIKGLACGGFEVIIGTDVTYVAEAIIPLFETAKELILRKMGDSVVQEKPALILCHVFRRVDEPSLLAAASKFGFKLADRWAANSKESLTIGFPKRIWSRKSRVLHCIFYTFKWSNYGVEEQMLRNILHVFLISGLRWVILSYELWRTKEILE